MDKALQREKTADRVRRYRALQKTPKGVTKEGVTSEGVTSYHPICRWLVDPIMRPKLERICESLSKFNVLDKVFVGCGRHIASCYEVSEWLEATR